MRASTPVSGRSMRLVQLLQAALLDRRMQMAPDLQRQVRALFRRIAQLDIEPAPRLFFERAAGRIGIQQEGIEHHVVRKSARLDAHVPQGQQRRLGIADDFRAAGIFEERPQRLGQREGHGARLSRLPRQSERAQGQFSLGGAKATATGAPAGIGARKASTSAAEFRAW